jgi:hypothetical protein
MGFLRQAMPEAESIETSSISGKIIYVGNYPRGKKHYARFVEKDTLCDVCADVHFVYTLDQEGIYKNIVLVEPLELYGVPLDGTQFLQQFIGKSYHQTFSAGDNVDIITGATISSRRVIEGLNETDAIFKDYISDPAFDLSFRKEICFRHQAEIEWALHRYEREQDMAVSELDLSLLRAYFTGKAMPLCPTGGIYQLINFNNILRVMCTVHGSDPRSSPF